MSPRIFGHCGVRLYAIRPPASFAKSNERKAGRRPYVEDRTRWAIFGDAAGIPSTTIDQQSLVLKIILIARPPAGEIIICIAPLDVARRVSELGELVVARLTLTNPIARDRKQLPAGLPTEGTAEITARQLWQRRCEVAPWFAGRDSPATR